MVTIEIDSTRREQLRRLHTATHILNFSARKVLGNHIWQNGSNLKPELGSLDITHYDQLTQEQISAIEREANEIVFADKKVTIEELERTQAEQKYGFVLYQGGAIPMKTLRVVSVLDSDIEACGGIHMETTGGIGLIKIVSASKIQDGVVRLLFVVREFAQKKIEDGEKILAQTQQVFSVSQDQIVKTAQKFFDEWKTQKKQIEELETKYAQVLVDLILSSKAKEYTLKGVSQALGFKIISEVLKSQKSFKLVLDTCFLATPDVNVDGAKKSIPKGAFIMHLL